jgi:hypothetical protein
MRVTQLDAADARIVPRRPRPLTSGALEGPADTVPRRPGTGPTLPFPEACLAARHRGTATLDHAEREGMQTDADCAPERGQVGGAPAVAVVHRLARPTAARAAIRAAEAAGDYAKGGGAVARHAFDAAARDGTKLVHAPFSGSPPRPVQTPGPARTNHAKCGRATPAGLAHSPSSPGAHRCSPALPGRCYLLSLDNRTTPCALCSGTGAGDG